MKNRRSFRIHPAAVVLGVALLIIVSLPVIRYLTPHTVEARFTLEERRARAAAAAPEKQQPNVFSETTQVGEAYTTAHRLTELQDLVVGLSIYSLTRPAASGSLEGVLNGMASERRLPPGLVVAAAQGKLNSPHSTFYVRYRPMPFALEVVSLPRTEQKGGAMLLRLPSDPDEPVPVDAAVRVELKRLIEGYTPHDKPYYGYFTSPHRTKATLPPAAFMPAAQMGQYGWTRDALPRPSKLNPQQINEQNAYLKTLEAGRLAP